MYKNLKLDIPFDNNSLSPSDHGSKSPSVNGSRSPSSQTDVGGGGVGPRRRGIVKSHVYVDESYNGQTAESLSDREVNTNNIISFNNNEAKKQHELLQQSLDHSMCLPMDKTCVIN